MDKASGGIVSDFRLFPGDRRTSALAFMAGGVGVITFVALALMYTMEISSARPRIFGPVSDIGSGIFSLLAAAVIAQMHRRLPPGTASRVWLAAVVVLSVAGAVGSFLLVAKILDFVVATTAAMLGLVAQALWLLFAHVILLKRGDYPPRLGRFGRFVGAAFLAGAAIVGLGFLLPAGWMQWGVFGLGGLIGLAGWIGMPFWYLMAGRQLRGAGVDRQPTPEAA